MLKSEFSFRKKFSITFAGEDFMNDTFPMEFASVIEFALDEFYRRVPEVIMSKNKRVFELRESLPLYTYLLAS